MIDEKPINVEIGVIKKVFIRVGDAANYIGNFFRFLPREARFTMDLVNPKNFVDETTDIIYEHLIKYKKGCIITYDFRTRDLAENLTSLGINVADDLFFVDCISYNQGKGAPPVQNIFCVNKPDDFENAFYYSVVQLEKMDSRTAFVAIIAPNNILKWADINDIGVFLKWYKTKMIAHHIPVVVIYPKGSDKILERVIENLT